MVRIKGEQKIKMTWQKFTFNFAAMVFCKMKMKIQSLDGYC